MVRVRVRIRVIANLALVDLHRLVEGLVVERARVRARAKVRVGVRVKTRLQT